MNRYPINVSMKFSSNQPEEVSFTDLVSQDMSGSNATENAKECRLEKVHSDIYLEGGCNLERKVILKPLKPKNSEDYYFVANKLKKRKNRKKTQILNCRESETVAVEEVQQSFWQQERVNDMFPQPQVTEDLLQTQELLEKNTEEVQYLSLEDFKVYKKRIPIEISTPEVPWVDTDFPNIKKGLTEIEIKKYVNRKQHRRPSTFVSRSCQTEEFLLESKFDFDMSIIKDMPDDLKGIFQRLLAQLKEYEELFSFVKKQQEQGQEASRNNS